MIYVLGFYLKEDSIALFSLSKLCGIGKHITKLIFNDLNISYNIRVSNLSQNILINIIKWIDTNKILIKNSLNNKSLHDFSKLKPITSVHSNKSSALNKRNISNKKN
jgi:ribosomal protein S13